jgi:hypothetical protein
VTRIDDIVSLFGSKAFSFGAIQFTPWNILLTLSEEKFWEFLNLANSFTPKMKFLERRSDDFIDLHFIFQNFPSHPLDITFRLISPSPEFLNTLRENYPFIEIFLR